MACKFSREFSAYASGGAGDEHAAHLSLTHQADFFFRRRRLWRLFFGGGFFLGASHSETSVSVFGKTPPRALVHNGGEVKDGDPYFWS